MSLDIKTREYLEIAASTDLDDTSLTVALRFRSTSATQWELAGRHQALTSFNGWNFSNALGSPNRIQFTAKGSSGGGSSCVDASANAVDGNWHHVVGRAVRTAGGTLDIMVDGTSATQTTGVGAWSPVGQVLRIGRSIDTFWADFIGEVADFAQWGARLTADEAAAYCKGVQPGQIRPGSLKLWMPLRGL